MKRFLTIVALTCVIMGNVLAVNVPKTVSAEMQPLPVAQKVQKLSEQPVLNLKSQEDTRPKKEVQKFDSVDDLYGYMVWRYVMGLNGYNGWQMGTISITPSEKPGYVTVTGLYGGFPVEAKYDLQEMTLKFYRQPLFYSDYYQMDIDLVPMYWSSTSSVDYVANGKPIVIQYRPDGIELDNGAGEKDFYYKEMWTWDDENDILGVTQDGLGGYFGLMYMNIFYPVSLSLEKTKLDDVFSYNPEEWTYCGTASMREGWVNSLYNESDMSDAYNVQCYRSKLNSDEVMLLNPYGKNTPYVSVNETDKDGYIVLNLSNPDCVLVRPCTPSGFSTYGYGEYFMSSYEGVKYYLDNYEYDDIIAECYYNDYEISKMSSKGMVSIQNARVGYIDNFFTYNQYQTSDGQLVKMVSYIQLPQSAYEPIESEPDPVEQDPVVPTEPKEYKVFDITAPTTWTGDANGYETTVTVDGHKFVLKTDKGTSSSDLISPVNNTYSWRVYKNSAFEVKAEETMKMTKVVITYDDMNSDSYCKTLALGEGWTGTLDGTVYTCSSEGQSDFSATASEAQVRIKDIVVWTGTNVAVEPDPVEPDPDKVTLTVAVENGMTSTLKVAKETTVGIGLDLDEYWTVTEVICNGADDTDLYVDNLYTTPALEADTYVEIVVSYTGEVEVIETTGVVEFATDGIKVGVEEGKIIVSGVAEGNEVVLYDMAGRVVNRVTSTGNALQLTPVAGNAYIVRINNNAVKVIL